LEVSLKNNDTTETFDATANPTATTSTTSTIDESEKKQATALAVTESTPPK